MHPTPLRDLDLAMFENPLQAGQAVAHAVAGQLAEALDRRGHATLAVSGGRTPGWLFDELARTRLDWSRVSITLVDERWVPPGTGDSNERLVRQRLLTRHAAAATFVPLKTRADHPAEAIGERSQAVRGWLLGADVVVLGMGEDGHVASLFPGAPGLDAALDAGAMPGLVATEPPGGAQARLGMNLAALIAARHVVLLAQGTQKGALLTTEARAARAGAPLPVDRLLEGRTGPLRMYWSP